MNHPHIAAIHGFEETEGIRAFVLELLEGPTLADRLAAGPLPVQHLLTRCLDKDPKRRLCDIGDAN